MSSQPNPGAGTKRKSISTKISFGLLAVLVPLLIILIICSCLMAANSIGSLNDKLLVAQADYAVSIANNFFNSKATAVSLLDRSAIFRQYFQSVSRPGDIDSYENKSDVLEQLSNVLKKLEGEHVEQVWLVDAKTDSYLLSTGEVAKANLADVTWDDDAYSNKSTVISEPFADPVTGKQVITIASPVFSGTNVVGLVGLDVFVETLANTLSEIQVGEEGYLELLSKDSNYIYSDDPTAVGRNVSELDISDNYKANITSKYEGVMDFSYGGTAYTAISRVSDVNSWLAIATLPMSEVNATRNQLILVLSILAAAFLAVMVVFIVWLIRRTIRPLTVIGQNMHEFALGNLGVDVEIKSNDEIGLLADNVRTTISTLKEIISDISGILSEISEGNLDVAVRGSYVGDFVPIREALATIIQSLNGTLGQINRSADQVASGSDQVASGAQALSQGATEQASSVEELAATINEISRQVNDTAQNAVEARDQSNEAANEVAVCNEQMQHMIAAMGEISNKSSEIGKIIKTIEDIAFQTNILALNAAVEAARAGAAGKGFAVVADEVRNLASKSAEASKNTSALIEGSIQAVNQGTNIANETAQSLLRVVESSKVVTSTVDKITDAAKEQSSSIAQVTQGIDQIANVVQTNSATAEESAAASEELSGQAQMLKTLVSRFRLAKADQPEDSLEPDTDQPQFTLSGNKY